MLTTTSGFSPVETMLADRIARSAPSIHVDGMRLTSAAVLDAARSVAARLRADGIRKGDLVPVLMKNGPEYLAVTLGAMFAGAIAVPINARFTASEVAHIFRTSPPRAWVADRELAQIARDGEGAHAPHQRYVLTEPSGTLRELVDWGRPAGPGPIVPLRGEDIGMAFFTAGTTGRPKGALTSHAAVASYADAVAAAFGITPADRVVLPMPMFYTGGFKTSLAVLALGAELVTFRDWKIPDLIEAMDLHRSTILWAVPSVWALILRTPRFDEAMVRSIRLVYRAGMYSPRKLIDDLVRVLPGRPHYHGYGLTECNQSTMEKDGLAYPESCGFPNPGVRVTIDGTMDRERVGEIWVTGPQRFSGYLNDPERTAATIQDGWVRTGDQGFFFADGRLRVIGRGSDIVIRGGENISTAEVEGAISEVPGVVEVAVVGVPDEIFGHELRAVVVEERPGAIDPSVVKRHCGSVLAEFKVPKFIDVRREPLPKNAGGKVVKAGL